VDARYEKVRVDGRVLNQGVLIVLGVRDDGFREILGVEIADTTESEATYQELLRSLKSRGLKGVELVVSDDHAGLKAAIARQFQGATYQRCQVHYARNLLGMVGHARRKELAEGLRGVFAAPSREVALRLAWELARKPSQGRRTSRGAHRGVPLVPGLSPISPQAYPHYECSRATKPGDKAAHTSGEDLPQQDVVPAIGECLGSGAI
jgi:transposase-like protein